MIEPDNAEPRRSCQCARERPELIIPEPKLVQMNLLPSHALG